MNNHPLELLLNINFIKQRKKLKGNEEIIKSSWRTETTAPSAFVKLFDMIDGVIRMKTGAHNNSYGKLNFFFHGS